MNSTLSTVSPNSREGPATERGRWVSLGLLAHEYFHLFNAKRLRPVELGPFDFEQSPTTGSLWIAEGVDVVLQRPAAHAVRVENAGAAPRVALQSDRRAAERAGTAAAVRRAIVIAGLAEQQLRRQSERDDGQLLQQGKRAGPFARRAHSPDHTRRSQPGRCHEAGVPAVLGDRGYTADEFRAVAEEIAGASLKEWFTSAVSSTEELDYTELLEWYGLRFTASTGRAGAWQIERRPDATDVQKRNLAAWLR